jgi:hypothetical protein
MELTVDRFHTAACVSLRSSAVTLCPENIEKDAGISLLAAVRKRGSPLPKPGIVATIT